MNSEDRDQLRFSEVRVRAAIDIYFCEREFHGTQLKRLLRMSKRIVREGALHRELLQRLIDTHNLRAIEVGGDRIEVIL